MAVVLCSNPIVFPSPEAPTFSRVLDRDDVGVVDNTGAPETVGSRRILRKKVYTERLSRVTSSGWRKKVGELLLQEGGRSVCGGRRWFFGRGLGFACWQRR